MRVITENEPKNRQFDKKHESISEVTLFEKNSRNLLRNIKESDLLSETKDKKINESFSDYTLKEADEDVIKL